MKSAALRAIAVAISLIVGGGWASAGQVMMPAEPDAPPANGVAMLLAAAHPSVPPSTAPWTPVHWRR